MADMFDALEKAGLLNQEQINTKKARGQQEKKNSALKHQYRGTKGIVAFDETAFDSVTTIVEFKVVAKGFLLENSNNLKEALRVFMQKAHDFRDRTSVKSHLTFCYTVKGSLEVCPGEKVEELIQRMFRRKNPKFSLKD